MPSSTVGSLPVPGRDRSWWLREALAAEDDSTPAPPLRGTERSDVVVIGGGFTGMWAAYFLTQRAPGVRITLLEQDICGGGPSGRNGGFAHGWWEDLPYLARRFGRDDGLEIAKAADEVVDGIGDWCVEHGVDAWYTKAGYVTVNAFPGFQPGWDRLTDELARLGAPDALRRLTAAQVQSICATPAFRDGLLMSSAASIHPARLARGLRREAVFRRRGRAVHQRRRARGRRLLRPSL